VEDGPVAFRKRGCLLALATAVKALEAAHGQYPPVVAVRVLIEEVKAQRQKPAAAFDALLACLCHKTPSPDSSFLRLDILVALEGFPTEAGLEQARQAALAQPEAVKAMQTTLYDRCACIDHQDSEEMARFLTALRFLGRLAAAPYYRQAIGADGRARLIEALQNNLLELAAQGGWLRQNAPSCRRQRSSRSSSSTTSTPPQEQETSYRSRRSGAPSSSAAPAPTSDSTSASVGPPLAVTRRPAAGPAPPLLGPIPIIPPAGAATSSSTNASDSSNPVPPASSTTTATASPIDDDGSNSSSSAPITTTAATGGRRRDVLGRFASRRLNPLRLLRSLRSGSSAANDRGTIVPTLVAPIPTPTPATAITAPSVTSVLPPSTSSTAAAAAPTMGSGFRPPVARAAAASARGAASGLSSFEAPPPPPMSFGFTPVAPAPAASSSAATTAGGGRDSPAPRRFRGSSAIPPFNPGWPAGPARVRPLPRLARTRSSAHIHEPEFLLACQIVPDLLAPPDGPGGSEPSVRPALQMRNLDVASRLAGVAGAETDAVAVAACVRIVQRVAEGLAAGWRWAMPGRAQGPSLRRRCRPWSATPR
jgi:hypothetical protein